MGANAQTSVPTFTAGEVLTAANMNISARTGVPVFATTTTRDAAFGGTGEKTLAEGQMAYVENLTGDAQIQYYDGSTWKSLGATGLTLVKTQTVGTAVSTVAVTNAFNSTYDNYLITLNGGTCSNDQTTHLQLGASTTGYYGFLIFGTSTAGTGVSGSNNNNGTEAQFVGGGVGGQMNHVYCNVIGPNLAAYTKIITGAYQSAGSYGISMQEHRVATAYTDFTLIPTAGTFTGGTVRVYGYQNS